MRSDVRKIAYISRRALALLLTLAMVLAIVPPIDIFAATQDSSSKQIVFDATEGKEYYHKPIVINETTMKRGMKNEKGEYTNVPFETRNGRYNILIKGEPFSVTVQGLDNVDITFNNVTIDRSADGIPNNSTGFTETSLPIDSGTAASFLQASKDLGWNAATGNNNYVPTCPFWIRDGAEVVVSFIGTNVFKAAGNLWRINADTTNVTALTRDNKDHYHGYAGIQIAPDSALTIASGTVEAWGSYQMTNIKTVAEATTRYPQSFSKTTTETQQLHPDVSTNSWAGNNAAGGAGIGGGADYNYATDLERGSPDNYNHFTPGSLTINTGNVTAIGGFKAAGIGGAVNGAMTAKTITINGDPATSAANKTTVTAIGSFFAAGIGEGDSVPDHESPAFTNPYAFVVNGGVVTAYGGYKAAGIGTTDEISDGNSGDLSGLTIDLNGGDITAHSGVASDTNNATAAIGAGDGTNMADYSISIAEGTVVKAVSYSKYAISNIGTSATTAPQNVVDPNTYMYLAYYDRSGNNSLTTNAEREFHLYQIKRTDRGDFMLVIDHPDDVLDDVTHQSVFLGYDEKTNHLYVVDQYGKTITDSKTQCEIFYIEYHENSTPLYSAVGKGVDADGNEISVNLKDVTGYEALVTEIGKLTQTSEVSYYFAEPEMKAFTVPAGYTAVAMTLYRPEDFGGRYIFHIPMPGSQNGDVYAVIEKMSSGDSSGQIVPEFGSHFTMGNPLKPGEPAVKPDKISATLTNLLVTSASSTKPHLGLDDAEKIFAPGTKSYAIWLPAGTTEFTVTPSWATNVTTTVTIREGTGANKPLTNPGTATTYQIGANDIKEIWIEKTDSGASKVVYKLTVHVKAKYTMDLTELNKTYDGMPVIPGVASMEVREYSEFTVTPMNADTPKVTTPKANNNTSIYSGKYSNRDVKITLNNKIEVTTEISAFQSNYSYGGGGNNATSYKITTAFSLNNGVLEATSATSSGFYLTNNDWRAQQYYLRAVDGVVGLATSSTGDVEIVFWSWNENANSTMTGGTVSYDQAVSAAKAEVVDKLKNETEIGKIATSSEINYGGTVTTTTTLSIAQGDAITSGTFTPQSLVWTHVATQNGKVQASASLKAITDKSSLLTNQTVEYTYVQTHNAFGVAEFKNLDTTAPTAAGTYLVTASVNATEFQASGERTFTISQRPITIIGIANWRYYLSEKDLANNAPPYIYITPGTGNDESKFYSGEIRLDNVVEYADGKMDQVKLAIAENGMYFVDKVVGDLVPNKIVIKAAIDATDSVSANYTFAGYPDHGDYKHGEQVSGDIYQFRVPGQITYEVDGAMFLYGKLTAADQADFLWYKYYPVINDLANESQLNSYLKFPDDERIDYHSPDSQTHAEHIYVRTVNEGEDEARYAVDITFGNMIFQYTKTIWNVNTLEYEKMDKATGETSVWVDPAVSGFAHGKALTNGDILIENRSNREISFTATAEINTHCVMVDYTDAMEFDETAMNQQHRVVARMIWGDTNVWKDEDITTANSRNTGSVGVATTPTIPIAAAENVGVNADSTALSNAPGYKIVSIRLFGIPTSSETVGSVTISLNPTN